MQTSRALSDFAGMLQLLYRRGTDYVVIGGCAVGAYAQLQGEAVFSADLDIMTTSEALHELLTWAPGQGVEVVKVPQPRSIPVAVLKWRKLEVNVLTGAPGLPGFGLVARMAREFDLQEHGIVVPIADPLDLLANKLVAGRDKDRAHIVIIRGFVEAEIVSAFEVEMGRQRVMLARRYLEVLGVQRLEEAFAERLLPLAKHPVDFRFLAGRVPTRRQAEAVVDRARMHDTDPDDVQLIVSTRTFDTE